MGKQAAVRQRPRISATVDPQLLSIVDAYVEEHPGYDRSKVVDEALALWYAHQQQQAMEAQFTDGSGVEPEEWEASRAIRDAAAARRLRPREHD